MAKVELQADPARDNRTINEIETSRALWESALAEFTHAERFCDDIEAQHGPLSDQFDHATHTLSDLEAVLVKMPAPDLRALRWKLEKLFAPQSDDGLDISGWSLDYARQAIADYRRLLGADAITA